MKSCLLGLGICLCMAASGCRDEGKSSDSAPAKNRVSVDDEPVIVGEMPFYSLRLMPKGDPKFAEHLGKRSGEGITGILVPKPYKAISGMDEMGNMDANAQQIRLFETAPWLDGNGFPWWVRNNSTTHSEDYPPAPFGSVYGREGRAYNIAVPPETNQFGTGPNFTVVLPANGRKYEPPAGEYFSAAGNIGDIPVRFQRLENSSPNFLPTYTFNISIPSSTGQLERMYFIQFMEKVGDAKFYSYELIQNTTGFFVKRTDASEVEVTIDVVEPV